MVRGSRDAALNGKNWFSFTRRASFGGNYNSFLFGEEKDSLIVGSDLSGVNLYVVHVVFNLLYYL